MALVLICLCNIASQLWLWCIIVAILIFGLDIYNKTNKTVRCLINSKDKNAGNCIYWVTLQCDTDFISQTMCKCVTTSEKKLCLINFWETSGMTFNIFWETKWKQSQPIQWSMHRKTNQWFHRYWRQNQVDWMRHFESIEVLVDFELR